MSAAYASAVVAAATDSTLPLPPPRAVSTGWPWSLVSRSPEGGLIQYQTRYVGVGDASSLVPWTTQAKYNSRTLPAFPRLPPMSFSSSVVWTLLQPFFDRAAPRYSALVRIGCVIAVGACTLGIMYLRYRTYGFRDWFTQLVDRVSIKPSLSDDLLRREFIDLQFTPPKVATPHTHGKSAADRSMATLFITRFGEITGLTPYFVQMSRPDQRKKLNGSRAYYFTKDLSIRPRPMLFPRNALRAYVDVDQYVDMPRVLGTEFFPTMLYTFQPHQVSRNSEEYDYTFDADNVVHYRVAGGGEYTHPVWNYSTDNVFTTTTVLGFPISASAFLVDRRTTSPDHELVLLTPLRHWTWRWAWLACLLNIRPLSRLRVAVGKFLRLDVRSTEGAQRSTGYVGAYSQALIPADVDDTIASLARSSKVDLTLPTAQQFVDGDRQAAAMLVEYHRTKADVKPDVVCPVKEAIRRYQYEPQSYEPEAKSMVRPFMAPVLHDCFVPDHCAANSRAAIKQRVTDVQSDATVTNFMSQCMTEFVDLLFPVKHILMPVDDDELYARQNRPSQRSILERSQTQSPNRVGSTFLKKETYGDIKPPRIITTFNGVDKAAYSKYTYALTAYVKQQPWYAFGRTPVEIAHRVTDVLAEADTAVNSDLSKFDGRVSPALRELEKRVWLAGFCEVCHDILLELHGSQFNLTCYTEFVDEMYEMLFSRGSGSGDTAIFNTIINAFLAFYTFRKTRQQLGYISAPEAWRRLGVYGGDDGVTANINPETYKKACADVGQCLTVDVVQRGNFGISFLARKYGPCVWYGDPTTCCDLPRQLAKLHVTVNLPPKVTPLMKLLEKVRSFALTDLDTPVIGDLCKAVIRVHGQMPAEDLEVSRVSAWHSAYESDVQFPNVRADWMGYYASMSLPGFDFMRFLTYLDNATTLVDFLSLPLCQEPKVPTTTIPVVVDDRILLPPSAPPAPTVSTPAVELPNPVVPLASRLRKSKASVYQSPRSKRRVTFAMTHLPAESPASTHVKPRWASARRK